MSPSNQFPPVSCWFELRFLAKITAQQTRVAPASASSPWWSAGQEKYIYNSMLCNVFKPTAHLTSAERTRCPVCGPAACSGTMTRGRPAPPPCTTSLSGTGESPDSSFFSAHHSYCCSDGVQVAGRRLPPHYHQSWLLSCKLPQSRQHQVSP